MRFCGADFPARRHFIALSSGSNKIRLTFFSDAVKEKHDGTRQPKADCDSVVGELVVAYLLRGMSLP
jgi:hypothetical protein